MSIPTEKQDHRSRIYFDPEIGKQVYRNSSLWSCIHSLVRERAGFTPIKREDVEEADDEAGDSREEGRIHETWFREVFLPRKGWHVTWIEEELDLQIGDGIVVRMHLDGALVPIEQKNYELAKPVRLLEIKTGNVFWSDRFLKEGLESFPTYLGQQASPMVYTGLPLDLYFKNRNNGQVYCRHLESPPKSYGQIVMRVLMVERLAQEFKESGNEAIFPGCEEMYRSTWGNWCPHKHLHRTPPPQIVRPDLEMFCAEYDQLRGAGKPNKVQKERQEWLRAELEKALGESTRMQAGGFEAGFYNGGSFIDLDECAKEDPDTYAQLKKKYQRTRAGKFFLKQAKQQRAGGDL